MGDAGQRARPGAVAAGPVVAGDGAGAAGAGADAAGAGSDTVETVDQRDEGVAGMGSVAARNPVVLQNAVFVRKIKVGPGASKAVRVV